jgi:hypothetical protein
MMLMLIISFQSSKLRWHLTALDDGNCRSQSTIVVVDLPFLMMPEEEGLKLLPVLIGGSINQCHGGLIHATGNQNLVWPMRMMSI